MAFVCGAAWGLIGWVIPFFSFNLVLAPAAGYAIAEVVSRSANRKRGMGLASIGGIAVVISYVVSILLLPFGFHLSLFHILDLLALALGIFVAVTRLR